MGNTWQIAQGLLGIRREGRGEGEGRMVYSGNTW
jgi:hypothetical protein